MPINEPAVSIRYARSNLLGALEEASAGLLPGPGVDMDATPSPEDDIQDNIQMTLDSYKLVLEQCAAVQEKGLLEETAQVKQALDLIRLHKKLLEVNKLKKVVELYGLLASGRGSGINCISVESRFYTSFEVCVLREPRSVDDVSRLGTHTLTFKYEVLSVYLGLQAVAAQVRAIELRPAMAHRWDPVVLADILQERQSKYEAFAQKLEREMALMRGEDDQRDNQAPPVG